VGGKHAQIWAFDAKDGATRLASVTNECVERDFYASVETILAEELDTPDISSLLDKIESGGAFALTRDKIGWVIYYVAFQLARTPSFREIANHMFRAVGQSQPRHVSEHLMMMVLTANSIFAELCPMKLLVVIAPPGSYFITSDCPVAYGPLLDGDTESHGLRHDVVAFPLSPKTVMLLSNDFPTQGYLEVGSTSAPKLEDVVRNTNRLIVRRCDRRLYSDHQHAPSDLKLDFPLERFRRTTQNLGDGFTRVCDVLTSEVP
jgi:hypothetical protein